MTIDVPESIKIALVDIERQKNEILALIPHARKVEEVLEILKVEFPGQEFAMHVGHWGILIKVFALMDNTIITPLLRILAAHGLPKIGEPRNYQHNSSKRWKLKSDKISLDCFFAEKGTCKYVKIGEKVIPESTENIYEFQCEGDKDESNK